MINTTIEIDAPLSKVWSVLLDLPTLRTCRSGLFKAVTPLSPTYPSPTALNPGNQLHVEIGPPFVGAITQNTPSCFEWKGLPNHGVLSGRHTFRFEESVVTKGGTTFVQNEEFGGVLWWVMSEWLAGRWLKAYEGFNQDLKRVSTSDI